MLVSITEKQLLAVVIQVKQVPCGRGTFRQKAMKSLWKAMFRHCGLHSAFGASGREQIGLGTWDASRDGKHRAGQRRNPREHRVDP